MLSVNSNAQEQEVGTEVVVIVPSTRRDGVSETIIKDQSRDHLRSIESKDLKKLSKRLEQFVEDMGYQLKLMESAIERNNYSSINMVAKKLAARCADIGSYRLMQLSYKLHICAKVDNFTEIPENLAELSKEFDVFRKQLIIT